MFNQTPLYKVGYTSAQQFRDFPMSGRPELFVALSVKYLLSDHDLAAAPGLVRVRDFGQLHLYRLADYGRWSSATPPAEPCWPASRC
ncbi:MAG TPA: hypothetical protein VFH68_18680 [Polyangia bacterium]|nr:hypothetical protein [Polyangia bacterium]